MSHLKNMSYSTFTKTSFFGCLFFFFFFFIWVFFHEHSQITGLQGKEKGISFFNSSLPLPPALPALRHWPGDCCAELTSAHSYQPGSNQESLVSEQKLLTTKLRSLTQRKISLKSSRSLFFLHLVFIKKYLLKQNLLCWIIWWCIA